jgi:hypothetical protein
MPLIQGGPPEWVWERTAGEVRCEVVPVPAARGGPAAYELRFSSGLEVVRLHFFTEAELRALAAQIQEGLPG